MKRFTLYSGFSYSALARVSLSLTVLSLLPSILTGCGGGGGGGSSSLSSTGTSAPAASSASLTIIWPSQPKTASGAQPALIPLAAKSITVTLKSTTNTAAATITQTVNRPTSGNTTTITFNLPPDTFTVTATAYPQSNGTGTAQATGTGTLTTKSGQTATLSINMSSTITSLTISPTSPTVVADSQVTLAASGLDASGAMVLLSTSKLMWISSNTSVATVNSSGVVTGVKMGSTTIKVTDAESGKSGTVSVTVPFVPYTITDLGTFNPVAINASGQMAGSAPSGNTSHAFLDSNGQLTDLGVLPGGTTSSAAAINAAGHVVGKSDAADSIFGTATHAFLYRSGKLTDLGALPFRSITLPHAINASDQIVGSSGDGINNLVAVQFHTDGTVPTLLGTLPSENFSSALAINASGQVVGYSESTDGDFHTPVLFHLGSTAPTSLGFLPGDNYGEAHAINASGQIVGYSFNPYGNNSGPAHAFLYSGGKMMDLGIPPGGGSSLAYGINDSGEIIGASPSATTGISFPFLYNSGINTALKSLLSTSDQAKWTLGSATGINNSGQICGYGTIGGQTHGFLMTPKP